MADDKRVDEIRARLEKATPGPWVYRDGEYTGDDNGFYPANDTEHVIGICAPNNRDFIAHSRSDIEYLLSELASLRVQLEGVIRTNQLNAEEIGVLREDCISLCKRAEAAEAENVRLRDALQSVVDSAITDSDTCSICLQDVTKHSAGCSIELARAALEGK